MKERYRLFRRTSGVYYAEDAQTGVQFSLHTKDKTEARQFLHARNETRRTPQLNLELARVYLAAHDPALVTRTWDDVVANLFEKVSPSTRTRRLRCWKSKPFLHLHGKKIYETLGDDYEVVVKSNSASAFHFLRSLQNRALTLGWMKWPPVTGEFWKRRPKPKKRRAISWAEHSRVLAAEQNAERRLFYDLLWEVGAAQTDGANLTAENVDWGIRVLSYFRRKTGELAQVSIGPRLEGILRQLPEKGLLFPSIAATSDNHRAAEFRRRMRLLKIDNVSLHSYRFAWAQRAFSAGYSER